MKDIKKNDIVFQFKETIDEIKNINDKINSNKKNINIINKKLEYSNKKNITQNNDLKITLDKVKSDYKTKRIDKIEDKINIIIDDITDCDKYFFRYNFLLFIISFVNIFYIVYNIINK